MTNSQTRQLRVLHCTANMGGGGAERQLTHLSGALVKKGVDVHVALCAGGSNMSRLATSGAEVHMLACRHNYDVSILLHLIRLIRRIRPHIVQTWMYQMDVLGGLAALVTNTPLVLSERTSAIAHGGSWKCRLRALIVGRGATVIANSEAGAAYWRERRIRTRVIRNIVAFDEIGRATAADGDDEGVRGGPLIIAAGRLYHPKNMQRLLEALAIMLQRIERATVLIFGEGHLRAHLSDMCRALHIADRVKLMGYTEHLYGWFKRADVFVSVSLYEGSPNTVQEAIACRCPVVVSSISSHRELLDVSSAFFVSPESAESIAEGIILALSDKETRQIKAQQAYAGIVDQQAHVIAEAYVVAYETMLSQ